MATFYNQAVLSYSGGTVNSNVTTGEIIESLSVTKTAVVSTYSQDSEVTYVINIVNSGDVSYTALTLTDNLGEYNFGNLSLVPLDYVDGSVKYFINGVLQFPPNVTSTNGLVITPINVPAGGIVTIVYTTETNEFAPPVENGSIVNTVILSGEGISDTFATEVVTSSPEPILSITKSLSPTTITNDTLFTYTIVIQNTGNAEATVADNVVVTDIFDPTFSDVVVTYNGTVWSSPAQYTYNPTTGEFATVSGAITVPAASFVQDETTGEWTVTPGFSTLTIKGTL